MLTTINLSYNEMLSTLLHESCPMLTSIIGYSEWDGYDPNWDIVEPDAEDPDAPVVPAE